MNSSLCVDASASVADSPRPARPRFPFSDVQRDQLKSSEVADVLQAYYRCMDKYNSALVSVEDVSGPWSDIVYPQVPMFRPSRAVVRRNQVHAAARLRAVGEERSGPLPVPEYGYCYLVMVETMWTATAADHLGFSPTVTKLLEAPRQWFRPVESARDLRLSYTSMGCLHLAYEGSWVAVAALAGIARRSGHWPKGSIAMELLRCVAADEGDPGLKLLDVVGRAERRVRAERGGEIFGEAVGRLTDFSDSDDDFSDMPDLVESDQVVSAVGDYPARGDDMVFAGIRVDSESGGLIDTLAEPVESGGSLPAVSDSQIALTHRIRECDFSKFDRSIQLIDMTDMSGYCYMRCVNPGFEQQLRALGPNPTIFSLLQLPRVWFADGRVLHQMGVVWYSSQSCHVVQNSLDSSCAAMFVAASSQFVGPFAAGTLGARCRDAPPGYGYSTFPVGLNSVCGAVKRDGGLARQSNGLIRVEPHTYQYTGEVLERFFHVDLDVLTRDQWQVLTDRCVVLLSAMDEEHFRLAAVQSMLTSLLLEGNAARAYPCVIGPERERLETYVYFKAYMQRNPVSAGNTYAWATISRG